MSYELAASLIVTTYNWPEALGVVLRSVLKQTKLPEEVVVADDGSGPETARVVENVLRPADLRWRHVWHSDRGIRQARIKNLGVRHSKAQYLIFIDHDVALHPDFVSDHLLMAGEGIFLQGKRSFLPEDDTRKILMNGAFHPPSPILPGLKNRKNAFRYPCIGKLISKPKRFQTSLRGCNLSMFKEDFFWVDGYDETFDQLWGREDSDICYRLFHSGLKVRNLWFSALQYHLHHEVNKNKNKDRLDSELLKNRNEKRKKALKGFSQLSQEGEVISASH